MSDELFAGQVNRWFLGRPRSKVEAFEFTLEGWPVLGFPKWLSLGHYRFRDQPKLGPARVYERQISVPANHVDEFFNGNCADGVEQIGLGTGLGAPRPNIDDLPGEGLPDHNLAEIWSEYRDEIWERAMFAGLQWRVVRAIVARGDHRVETLTLLSVRGDNETELKLCAGSLFEQHVHSRGETALRAEVFDPHVYRPLPSVAHLFVIKRASSADLQTYRSVYQLE